MKPNARGLFFFVTIMLLVTIACIGSGTPVTATLAPTNTPAPINTPAPTNTSAPTSSNFELDKTIHNHPSGAFSYYPPVGWTIEETDSDVFVKNPDSGVFFYAAVTNTGIPLDAASYENFVNVTDNFYYSTFDNYVQSSYSTSDAKDVIIIEKSYTFEGKTQFVRSIYNQFGQAAYVFELLGTESIIKDDPGYDAVFEAFVNAITLNNDAAAALPIYALTWKFVGPDNSMTIAVPVGWTYALDDRKTYTDAVIESLTSPEGAALIENISVVDGNTYTMGNAGQVALFLLNDRYSSGGGDVRVSKTKILNDGSEFWTWKSIKGGYSGTTNFELRNGGKQILLLSFVTYNATVPLYQPLFDRVLGTYAIP